jgi:predicted metal-dependent enzyme (double-stranded beta helix superfamily)
LLSRARDRASACADLIYDLHDIARSATGEAPLVARVAERLACSADERRWLVGRYRKVPPKQYAQNVVYVAEDRSFSVVALTWGPGAQTSIHDHAGWCAVGVYEGVEHERRYRLCTDASSPYLVHTQSGALELGRSVGMVADGFDIHRVGNYSRDVTISLHVYGVDIERVGSSIKSRFDALPVRS